MKSRCILVIAVMAALCVVLLAFGCGATQSKEPRPSDEPIIGMVAATAAGVESPTPLKGALVDMKEQDKPPPEPLEAIEFPGQPVTASSSVRAVWDGAATPGLGYRIHDSDVVVRATFVSASSDSLRFNAVEYLKGTGPTTFDVAAPTDSRPTNWDQREAVLFLTHPGAGGAAGASGSTYGFTKAWGTEYYSGTLPEGYTIGSRSPAWLPSSPSGGASGQSDTSTTYIVDSQSPGGELNPTVSLVDLREIIGWQAGGEGIEDYDDCVLWSVEYENFYRDYEAFWGFPWNNHIIEKEILSGAPAGTLIDTSDRSNLTHRLYDKRTLSGHDAALFSDRVADDDSNAANGYMINLESSRPLPPGTYQFTQHSQMAAMQPCNFTPELHKLYWVVTATHVGDALHETLFDPVALGAGVGVDGVSGVLEPAEFSVGETSTSVTGLKWESGKVVLSLSTQVSLEGYRLEFIELDGSVGLSLEVDDASVDAGAGTLTWEVSGRPWEDGDLLMLRIVGG